MFELKYPVPGNSVQQGAEDFPLVDESGNVVGRATRKYCHSGSMALHPVIHLHILSHDGRLYLQKRSMRKDIAPGRWDTSVGGHIDYGEHVKEALAREAREELGLNIEGMEVKPLFNYIWQSSVEREVVNAFAIEYEGEITPDHDEVDEGRFWTFEQLKESLGKDVFTQQFEKEELQRLINYFAKDDK